MYDMAANWRLIEFAVRWVPMSSRHCVMRVRRFLLHALDAGACTATATSNRPRTGGRVAGPRRRVHHVQKYWWAPAQDAATI